MLPAGSAPGRAVRKATAECRQRIEVVGDGRPLWERYDTAWRSGIRAPEGAKELEGLLGERRLISDSCFPCNEYASKAAWVVFFAFVTPESYYETFYELARALIIFWEVTAVSSPTACS